MTTKEVIPYQPVPVAKDDLQPQVDFCASVVDPNIDSHTVDITKRIHEYNDDVE